MSRRKQLRPNRLGMTEAVGTVSLSPLLQDGRLDGNSEDLKFPLQKGSVLGPFPLKNDSNADGITVSRQWNYVIMRKTPGLHAAEPSCGRERLAQFDELPYHLLKRLSIVDYDGKDHNCVLIYKDGHVTLEVVKTIEKDEPIVAVMRHFPSAYLHASCMRLDSNHTATKSVIRHSRHSGCKNFSCERCETKFSDKNTLEAHQTYYCQKKRKILYKSDHRPKQQRSDRQSAMYVTPASLSPFSFLRDLRLEETHRHNVILLPCAYTTDSTLMGPRILGDPQTIIPVAVPIGFAHDNSNSLRLCRDWCEGVDVRKKVELNVTVNKKTNEDGLVDSRNSPLDLSQKDLLVDKTHTEGKSSSGPSEQPKRVRPASTQTCKSQADSSIPPRDQSVIRYRPACANPPDLRRYVCPDCNVKFTSLETLGGHMRYYCGKQNASVEGRKSTNSTCQRCDQADHSSTHVTTTPQNFFCSVCGYRGYSHRGMKSHLRTHDSMMEPTALLSDKVVRSVKSELRDSISSSEGSENSSTDSSVEAEQLEKCETTADPTATAFHYLHTPDGMRFACGFCSYLSPYKGNVRRHLSLVHKDKHVGKARVNESSGEDST